MRATRASSSRPHLDKPAETAIRRAIAAGSFKGGPGQVIEILAPEWSDASRVLVAGVGRKSSVNEITWQKAAASIVKRVLTSGAKGLAIVGAPDRDDRRQHRPWRAPRRLSLRHVPHDAQAREEAVADQRLGRDRLARPAPGLTTRRSPPRPRASNWPATSSASRPTSCIRKAMPTGSRNWPSWASRSKCSTSQR